MDYKSTIEKIKRENTKKKKTADHDNNMLESIHQ